MISNTDNYSTNELKFFNMDNIKIQNSSNNSKHNKVYEMDSLSKIMSIKNEGDKWIPINSFVQKMLENISNKKLFRFVEAEIGMCNYVNCDPTTSSYFYIYPNNVVDILNNPYSEHEVLKLSEKRFFINIKNTVESPDKYLQNKIFICSELVSFNGRTKSKKVLDVKSYVYRFINSEDFYVCFLKDDLEKIINFYDENEKEYMNSSEKKVYSVDVFPEEARNIVPKIVNMMSTKNYVKLNECGYPCQFGLILVGPPGTGKTVFVKYLSDMIYKSEYMKNKFRYWNDNPFQNIKTYGVNDIHKLINNSTDMANEGLILLDDIDGAIIERSSNDNHEGRQTLPWLLTQLDRFSEDDCNIHRLIILCCNKLEYVDPALIRPGRFDRIITFKQPDNNIINNMINFVMKNDTNITDEIKQEIANFYENQHPNVSLADISLMGRLYYGGLVNSWMEAASWAINRGDSKQDDLIIKRNTNKVGF